MRLWYVSYGSNMCADRFACYLRGGRPAGGMRTYPGARDHTWPVDARATTLPGRIVFAGRSRTWGGGMAFYDPTAPGPAPARAYLITVEQFADVAAQESDREPVVDGPLEAALLDPSVLAAPGDEHVVDDGLYSRLVRLDDVDGLRSLTFTSGTLPEPNPPSAPYVETISRGLAETHGWDADRIAAYFELTAGRHR